jgi:hypothetical protein
MFSAFVPIESRRQLIFTEVNKLPEFASATVYFHQRFQLSRVHVISFRSLGTRKRESSVHIYINL